jgi:hypothetical protein
MLRLRCAYYQVIAVAAEYEKIGHILLLDRETFEEKASFVSKIAHVRELWMDELQIVAVSASATFKVRYIGDYIGIVLDILS